MKRFFTVLLAAYLSVSAACPVFAEDLTEEQLHQCGANMFWTIEDNGNTFHVTGTGFLDLYGAGKYDPDSMDSQPYEYDPELIDRPPYELYSQVRNIIIDEGCTGISSRCFAGLENAESFSLPDSLEWIGEDVFISCSALKEICLPDSIRTLPYECFAYCESLEKVHLPANLDTIGEQCFLGCPLQEMNIPDGLMYIGQDAFYKHSEWYMQFADLDYTVLGKCLYKVRDNGTGIYTVPDGVEIIGPFAFPYNDDDDCPLHITALTLPDSVTQINEQAFEYTDFSENFTDDFVILGDGLLYRYQGNARVVRIPEGVKHICDNAFCGNRTAISVHFPESVRSIGKSAFESSYIQEVYLNDGLERIGQRAFFSSALTEIRIPESVVVMEHWTVNDGGNIKIIGTPGSAAEAYALENNNTFVPYTAPFNAGHDMTPVYGKDNWSISNGSDFFGSGYHLNDDAKDILLNDLQIVTEEELEIPFGGSCYGLSLTMILAKAGLLAPEAMQEGAHNLADVEASDISLSVINFYHFLCKTAEHQLTPTTSLTPEQKLMKMIAIAENVKNGEIPFLMSFSFSAGYHAMVGYGIESGEWEWNGETYNNRILIWDPNAPRAVHDTSCIYYSAETLNFCIPYYNVYYAGNQQTADGKIVSFTNDLSVLNVHPYPFAKTEGDLNGNGAADIADAVLLCKTLAENSAGSETLMQTADFDGDGALTLLDFRMLLDLILTR